MTNQRGSAAGLALIVLTAVLVLSLAGCFRHHESVKFDTPYQAVLLANGSVYFGHLSNYGGRNPVLTDVFYIVNQEDPATKQVNHVLVKRGKELHEPDKMYISPNQIVFVEPVGKNSKVAQLIAQAEPEQKN